MEVLSSSTAKRDRVDAFRLYQQHGSRDYWIVGHSGPYIEVYQRTGVHLTRVGVFAGEGSFTSAVLEVSLSLNRMTTNG